MHRGIIIAYTIYTRKRGGRGILLCRRCSSFFSVLRNWPTSAPELACNGKRRRRRETGAASSEESEEESGPVRTAEDFRWCRRHGTRSVTSPLLFLIHLLQLLRTIATTTTTITTTTTPITIIMLLYRSNTFPSGSANRPSSKNLYIPHPLCARVYLLLFFHRVYRIRLK